jgi:hypothetical protein
MTGTTLVYALNVLEAQYRAILTAGSAESIERQRTYYDGMRRMLEIIVSDSWTQPYDVQRIPEDRVHKIVKTEG